jgi:hypothetical protein
MTVTNDTATLARGANERGPARPSGYSFSAISSKVRIVHEVVARVTKAELTNDNLLFSRSHTPHDNSWHFSRLLGRNIGDEQKIHH